MTSKLTRKHEQIQGYKILVTEHTFYATLKSWIITSINYTVLKMSTYTLSFIFIHICHKMFQFCHWLPSPPHQQLHAIWKVIDNLEGQFFLLSEMLLMGLFVGKHVSTPRAGRHHLKHKEGGPAIIRPSTPDTPMFLCLIFIY